ncbi:amidase [Waterburya agarophytonicola K14]|uniref:Amidase n=1 Tax=Waterburya agarophytonicola KI4 TaxID=2874699 RepID=A0A964FGK8_9CYAN|nr:amidase [Waterburya agarophytonicola]MCC0179020.1 amidase [Waterburya agarophytonicola KI4]
MNIVFATASQLAQMIREQEISSVEVVNAYHEQIEKYNNKINAVITLDTDKAKQKAIEADAAIARGENWGALHGVPVTIKDTLATEGIRTTAGYPPLKDYVPLQDATTVARLRAAGAIIIGKTNLPKLAIDYQSNNPLFGRTNNPWGLDYTPGGSSGGSASAVAAGFSALDLGSDFGGSIRLPAHYCGVYGFMPTDGRVATTGHIPPLPGQPKYVRTMLRVGALARSVADLELCLSLIAGADNRQPEIPPVALDKPANKQLSELRIAWTYGYDFLPISQDTRLCIQDLINRLTDAGVNLTQSQPIDITWSQILTNYGILSFFELFASTLSIKDIFRGLQFALTNEFLTQTQTNYSSPFRRKTSRAFPPSLAKYKAILNDRDRAIVEMDCFIDPWDAWICPVSLSPAFPHCNLGQPIEVDGVKFPYLLACGGYTMPLNFTGNPVVVIPIGKTEFGLPIGVQIVGKRWQDLGILAIANQISQVVRTWDIQTYESKL